MTTPFREDLSSSFNEKHEDTIQEVKHMANKAGKGVRNMLDEAGEDVSSLYHKATGEIQSHPLRSSAIAMGIGALLMIMLRR